MQFNYQSIPNGFALTETQKLDVIQGDDDYLNGKITARNWDDMKRDLESVYR